MRGAQRRGNLLGFRGMIKRSSFKDLACIDGGFIMNHSCGPGDHGTLLILSDRTSYLELFLTRGFAPGYYLWTPWRLRSGPHKFGLQGLYILCLVLFCIISNPITKIKSFFRNWYYSMNSDCDISPKGAEDNSHGRSPWIIIIYRMWPARMIHIWKRIYRAAICRLFNMMKLNKSGY